MQAKTAELEQLSSSLGLHIHPGKSKILKVKSTNTDPITVNGNQLEEVQSFTYLGSIVDDTGGSDADVKARTAKARLAFNSMSKIWKDSGMSLRTKCRLFNSNVKSVLLYGCETWKLTQTNTKKLQTFVNTCLRKILKIRWPEKIRNEELWERTQQNQMVNVVGQRRWRWTGHTLRKPATSIVRQALTWNPQGHRNRGRPRMTWRRCMEDDMKRGQHIWQDIQRLAQDRNQWKDVVRGLYPDTG